MKRLFNGVILICLATLMAACDKNENIQQEQDSDKIKISLTFNIANSPLSTGGPMAGTKGTAEGLFDAIYEGIVSGEIVAAYELTFTNKSTGATTIFNGRWNDGKTISIEKGSYTITGACTAAGNGIYNQCSLTLQDEATITEQTTTVKIKAQYDCSLLILNDETVDKVVYYVNENDSTYFAQYKTLTYAFLKSAADFIHDGKAFLKVYFKNGKSSIVRLGQFNIQRGMYYIIEDFNNYLDADAGLVLDIDKMQNGDEGPISFAITERGTTGTTNVEAFNKYIGTFAVWATKKSNNNVNATWVVMDDFLITYDATKMEPNNWTYKYYRYWDHQATYDFVAVAPNSSIIKYNKPDDISDYTGKFVTTDAKGYTLVGQNLQSTTNPDVNEILCGFKGGYGEDTDLMISNKVRESANRPAGDVNLQFKHILAKLNVSIAKDPIFDNVKVVIKSVKVTGLDDNGVYYEPTSDQTSGWTSSIKNTGYELSWANADGIELPKSETVGENQVVKPLYFIESLVMPQTIEANVEKLILDYTIKTDTRSENYNYILNLNDGQYKVFDSFTDGNKYSIKLTVRPNVITFDTTTENWTYNAE